MSLLNKGRIFNGLRLRPFKSRFPSLRRVNEAIAALNALLNIRVTRGSSDQVLISDAGTVIQLRPDGGTQTTDNTISTYIVKEHFGDYLRCRTWNESADTEGDTDVYIAKPHELRFSVTEETIDGYTITYSEHSTANQTRLAYYSATHEEDQVIVPRYLTGGDFPTIIRAQQVSGGTGVTVNDVALVLEDCNRGGRAWAVKSDVSLT